MFERYTERARRVIFFARYETTAYGSRTIETEHLLLGLLREDKDLINRFFPSGAAQGIRQKIDAVVTRGAKVSTSLDLPLSDECKRILAYANEEAEMLTHRHIGTEHLLLGILRESGCLAARLLGEAGLKLDDVRADLAESTEELELPSEESLPPADRLTVQSLVHHLPSAALAKAKWILERLLAHQAADGPDSGTPELLRRDKQDRIMGRFSSTRIEGGTTVVDTHQFVNGHQISITERFRMNEDGKTLSYSQLVVGPKPEQQHKHSVEFDVS